VRIKDTGGFSWVITRRLSPWRRKVQPVNYAFGRYHRFRVVPLGGVEESPRARAKRVRVRRRDDRRRRLLAMEDRGGLWLLLYPGLLVVNTVITGFTRMFWEIRTKGKFLIGILLLPFAFVELLAQLIAGGALLLARVTGMARSRVDVLAEDKEIADLHSLTVLTLPGFSAAGGLVSALAQQRAKATRPFDPRHDPELGNMFAHFQVRVEEHVGMNVQQGAGREALSAANRLTSYPYR
jgi:hypothetical protein